MGGRLSRNLFLAFVEVRLCSSFPVSDDYIFFSPSSFFFSASSSSSLSFLLFVFFLSLHRSDSLKGEVKIGRNRY